MKPIPMICAAAFAALAMAAVAAAQPAGPRQEMLTYSMEPAKAGAKLTVTSPAFKQGGAIPMANSAYGQNQMPGLSWTAGPAGTKSYLVIVEDPDAPTARPYLHWIAAIIPATTTTLPPAMVGLPGIIQSSGQRTMNSTSARVRPQACTITISRSSRWTPPSPARTASRSPTCRRR